MPKKPGIGGFNKFMSKPTRPAGPMIGIFPQRQPVQPAARPDAARAMAARRQVTGRASDARAQNQGRVAAAQRKAAQRGRGR